MRIQYLGLVEQNQIRAVRAPAHRYSKGLTISCVWLLRPATGDFLPMSDHRLIPVEITESNLQYQGVIDFLETSFWASLSNL
jgi:hypothetical protein